MKVNKFFLIALLVTALGCGYVYFFTGTRTAPPPSPVPAPLDASAVRARAMGADRSGENRVVRPRLDAVWDGDPFELPQALSRTRVDAGRSALKLVAILSSKGGRVAIIGSEVVKEGDLVQGERVQEIGRASVVLGHGDTKRYLTLEDGKKQEVPGGAGTEDRKKQEAPGNTSTEVAK